jgi:membrane associated rhomboid family serine protease
MFSSASAIRVIIVICVALFLITLMVPDMHELMFETLALYYPANEKFRLWQFVTNVFMHGGFAHIFFNMYALWAFGTPLEQLWGKRRFLIFFLLCGVGAALIYTFVNYLQFTSLYNDFLQAGVAAGDIDVFVESGRYIPATMAAVGESQLRSLWGLFNIPAVGASGAIYGILVAFGLLFPNAKLFLILVPVPIPAKYFIPALIGLDLFSGVTGFSIFGGGVAHFAHVGGAIIGFLLMWSWRARINRRRRDFGL